jgi:pimeloyl-ACP methyl ester carboxylesterase
MDGQVSYLNALRHLSAMTYMVVGNHTEFLKVLGILRQKYSPNELPYHVIVPSLPGYTLSSGPPLTKDWNTEDIGRIMNKLMIGLGFGNGYISQGGDIGAFVSCVLTVNHKECHGMFLYEPLI